MRKHLSIFMLIVRSSIYKVLLVFLAMAAAEAALVAIMQDVKESLLFELVDQSHLFFVYVAATALVQIIMLGVCTSGSARPRYTLARLSVSEKTVMLWHWLCGALCFIALWLWQMLLVYAFALWHHAAASPDVVSHQSIYLATFRSEFLHSLLPLDDVSRIARNIVMAISMGGVNAASAFKMRRGKKALFGSAFLIALYVGVFRAEHFEISYDAFVMTAFAIVTAISMGGVFMGDAEVDYEEAALDN